MKLLIIHSKATQELDESIGYYEDKKVGLGLEFLAEVERVFNKIQQNRSIGIVYKNTELHRYIVQRFPFSIFYTELEEFIWVVAIAHNKRRPDYWQARKIEE